jgi:hypothetical protein
MSESVMRKKERERRREERRILIVEILGSDSETVIH